MNDAYTYVDIILYMDLRTDFRKREGYNLCVCVCEIEVYKIILSFIILSTAVI